MSTSITKELEPWEVFHPEGFSMFYCDDKKAKWYLRKNLAEIVDERKIKLLFKPNGPGEDPSVRLTKNITCVCCNSQTSLTKHHIVPTQYRKQLPLKYKEHYSYDVVLLCKKCHESYERKADVFKKNNRRKSRCFKR